MLRDAGGREIDGGQTTVSLGENGQVVRWLHELFPAAPQDFEGAVTGTSSGGAVVVLVTRVSGRSASAVSVRPLH